MSSLSRSVGSNPGAMFAISADSPGEMGLALSAGVG
jgi:hypothetical protein